MSAAMPVAVVKVTYEMKCPKCGTGYCPEYDPCGVDYQCDVCETIFRPIDKDEDMRIK
jgi:Zn finger protein HypA/HybF involved in hydrogenase expression